MRHLSRDELLDAAEGRGARRDHLETCGACRGQVEVMTRVLAEAGSVEVPEPSPLFWERLSQRVSDTIREEAPARPGAWRGFTGLRVLAGAGAVAAILALLVVARWTARQGPSIPAVPAAPPVAVAALPPLGAVPDAPSVEPSWGVLETLAAEADVTGLEVEEAAALPGAADGALQQLSAEERDELVRLLKTELSRRGGRTES
jgi:hypothetical protein